MNLTLTILPQIFAVCRLEKESTIPDWAMEGRFYSITKTNEEVSIVCEQDKITGNYKIERDWKVFKVEGPLDFSLTGIMANLSSTLSNGNISIFAVSTYDTDYIMVKKGKLEEAITLFRKAGHKVNE